MISQDQKPHGNTIYIKKKKERRKVLFLRSNKSHEHVLLTENCFGVIKIHQAKSILHWKEYLMPEKKWPTNITINHDYHYVTQQLQLF